MGEYSFKLRNKCAKCGSEKGQIKPTNGQDVVFCEQGHYQYNAPKVETGKIQRTVTTVHNGITAKKRATVLMRATGRCELCGKSSLESVIHAGHIVSVKQGLKLGLTEKELNDPENLCALCDECNLGLSDEILPIRLLARILLSRLKVKGRLDE